MDSFKQEEPGKFSRNLKRLAKDLEESCKRRHHRFDSDLFIAKTLGGEGKSTYSRFCRDYYGRSVGYSTFIEYSAGALYMEAAREKDYSLEECAEHLIELSISRKVEKIDRLRGKLGRTILVDLIEKYDSPEKVHAELSRDWKKHQKTLEKQGCWRKKPRATPFGLTEIEGMYDFVRKFSHLFPKQKKT